MKTLKQTKHYNKWLNGLDAVTRARIIYRVRQAVRTDHFGDHHGIKGAAEISEMRLDFGPGYRLYYTTWEYRGQILLLLLGGDKSTQTKDIKKAQAMLSEAKARAEREIDDALEQRREE